MKLKHTLLIFLSIALVLFVFIPAAYIFLGKLSNPFVIQSKSAFDESTYGSLSANSRGALGTASGNLVKSDDGKDFIDCSIPRQSLAPHIRDAKLMRNGEESIVSSQAYAFTMPLSGPVLDWQYTNGSLEDEVASFVYGNTILNIMARSSVPECERQVAGVFTSFHEQNTAVEYFSSKTYVTQGKSIGLVNATLRTHGQSKIGGHTYYWYILDEQFARPTAADPNSRMDITSMWFSTRTNGTEYWFAFRTAKIDEDDLNPLAEEILGDIEFEK